MSADAFPAFETTRKRRRWGCTCGCVFFVVVLLLATLVGTYYTFRQNPPVARDAMMDSSVNGFGVVRLNPRDPGTGELLRFIFRRVEQNQKVGLPESDAKVVAGFLKVLRQFITTLVHSECPVYLAYDPASRKEAMVSVLPLKNQLSRILLHQFLTKQVSPPVEVRDQVEIYAVHSPTEPTSETLVALAPTSLLYGNDAAMLERSLEYRAEPNRDGEPSERLQQYLDELALDQPPEGEDGTIVLVSEEGRLTRLLESFEERLGVSGLVERLEGGLAAQRTSMADVLALKGTLDLLSVDKARGDITLYFRQSDVANRFASVIKQALGHVTGERADGSIQLSAEVRTRGTALVIDWQLSGLKAWLERVIPVAEVPASETMPDSSPSTAVSEGVTTAP